MDLRLRLTLRAAEWSLSRLAGLKRVTATTTSAVSNIASLKRDACAETACQVAVVVVAVVMMVV